jgi:hypothetical protein
MCVRVLLLLFGPCRQGSRRGGGSLLFLAGEERVDGGVELCAAFEEIEFEHEDVAKESAAEFVHERACCSCRAACALSVIVPGHADACDEVPTCSNDIVHHQHLLPLLDGIALDLEKVRPVLLLVSRRLTRPR